MGIIISGVNVMLYERSPKNNIIRPPWAIKKLNKRISVKSEYAKRLEEEAEILKKLQHPNIIGYRGKLALYLNRNTNRHFYNTNSLNVVIVI